MPTDCNLAHSTNSLRRPSGAKNSYVTLLLHLIRVVEVLGLPSSPSRLTLPGVAPGFGASLSLISAEETRSDSRLEKAGAEPNSKGIPREVPLEIGTLVRVFVNSIIFSIAM